MEETKVCTKCGEEKELREFYRREGSSDGRRTDCKECCSKNKRKYYENNREIFLKKSKEVYLENSEYIKERQRNYTKKNKEYISKKSKEKRELNRDRIREKERLSYYRNREKKLLAARKLYEVNKDKKSEYNKKYRIENKDELVLKKKKYANGKALFKTFADRLTVEESPIENEHGFMLCKCFKCGKYFYPTVREVSNRITSLNTSDGKECHLYDSQKCKQECDVFKAKFLPKSQRDLIIQARCNQDLNREMLLQLQLDEFGYNFCEVCGVEFDQKDLFIHHNLMVSLYLNEADNMSHQILVCRSHHTHKDCFNKS